MKEIEVKKIWEHADMLQKAAQWFHEKWDIPAADYQESMETCIMQKNGVPQWYFVQNENQDIIAGAGVIENDFHDRKDLTPNLCALFVEEAYRGQGIARCILDYIRNDFGNMGLKQLYLVTDHTAFYEKCGWTYLTMVKDEEGTLERMYYTSTM